MQLHPLVVSLPSCLPAALQRLGILHSSLPALTHETEHPRCVVVHWKQSCKNLLNVCLGGAAHVSTLISARGARPSSGLPTLVGNLAATFPAAGSCEPTLFEKTRPSEQYHPQKPIPPSPAKQPPSAFSLFPPPCLEVRGTGEVAPSGKHLYTHLYTQHPHPPKPLLTKYRAGGGGLHPTVKHREATRKGDGWQGRGWRRQGERRETLVYFGLCIRNVKRRGQSKTCEQKGRRRDENERRRRRRGNICTSKRGRVASSSPSSLGPSKKQQLGSARGHKQAAVAAEAKGWRPSAGEEEIRGKALRVHWGGGGGGALDGREEIRCEALRGLRARLARAPFGAPRPRPSSSRLRQRAPGSRSGTAGRLTRRARDSGAGRHSRRLTRWRLVTRPARARQRRRPPQPPPHAPPRARGSGADRRSRRRVTRRRARAAAAPTPAARAPRRAPGAAVRPAGGAGW